MSVSKKIKIKKIGEILTVISLIVGIPYSIKLLFLSDKPDQKQSGDTFFITNNNETSHSKGLPDSIFMPKQKRLKEVIPNQQLKFDNKKIKIAVLPFECITAPSEYNWLSKGIPETVLKPLSTVSKYTIIERNLVDKILNEIKFQQGKYVNPQSAVKIGKLIGSQQVIIGSYQVTRDTLTITSRVVNVQDGSIEKNSVVEHRGAIDKLFEVENDYSFKLVKLLDAY